MADLAIRPSKNCKKCGTLFYKNKRYSHKQWATAEWCSRKCSAWSSGLTKHDDPRLMETSKRVAIWASGRAGWNKGLTKHNDARMADIAKKVSAAQIGKRPNANQLRGLLLGRNYFSGKTKDNDASVARRSKILSEKYSGKKNPEHSRRMRRYYAEHPDKHPNSIVARKTKGHGYTHIESIVAELLGELGISFKFNSKVGSKWPDFKIDDAMLIIEADGERWHKDSERELRRDKYLQSFGWSVLHLTGSQIVAETQLCKNLIRDAVALGRLKSIHS